MVRRTRRDTSTHAVKAFIQQGAQRPSGAISRQAIEIMNMNIGVAVGEAFGGGVDFIKPVIGNDLSGPLLIRPALEYPVLALALIRQSVPEIYSDTALYNPHWFPFFEYGWVLTRYNEQGGTR